MYLENWDIELFENGEGTGDVDLSKWQTYVSVMQYLKSREDVIFLTPVQIYELRRA